jgi:hypothetical protein
MQKDKKTQLFTRYTLIEDRGTPDDAPLPETDAMDFSEQPWLKAPASSHEIPGNKTRELSEEYSEISHEIPRIISPEIPEKYSREYYRNVWINFVNNNQRFHEPFLTKAVAFSDKFHQEILDILNMAVLDALARISERTKKKVRIHQVFYQTIILYDDKEQYVFLVGSVIAEPFKGLFSVFARK